VYLNELRTDDYLRTFAEHLEIVECDYVTEGHDQLTPEIRAELSGWSEADLTRRSLITMLRKPT
jgi:hypothetical protein